MNSLDRNVAGRPIVLTTDFGPAGPYAGVMKGVVLGINPGATLIDLSHDIQPQNVRQAAFVLGASYRYFPPGAIHVVVVDPGVGTRRRALLLATPHGSFLAPDNGVLCHVIGDYMDRLPERPGRTAVPPGLSARSLTVSRYWRHPVSRTFHGRDIFAPVAAHLSLGVTPESLGRRVKDLVWLPAPRPEVRGNAIMGEVVYADHFGNLVTNIPGEALAAIGDIHVEVRGRRIAGLSRTFHQMGRQMGRQVRRQRRRGPEDGLLALVGSHGYLEVAVQDGSAALNLGAGAGETVRVTATP